ncbi:MAG TPA: LytTR family DNA-binding domain-containing protein, partial [Agriterribacter sp.]|nr:LytTR family DNA-binding domain-containing protein [Agriterribacter sp.]
NTAEKGIAAINQFRPDLVFLDIEMPNMNGFDMLEKFDELFFDVVFITAYHQFAIKAFRYSALNYLLKPVDPDDLVKTIHRIEKRKSSPLKEQMDLLMETVRSSSNQTIPRIALTTSDGLLFVNTADIIFCESDSNYTRVALKDKKKILVSKTLKEIDDTLSGKDFYRIHNSFLINLNHINKYVRGDGGYVVMDDGTPISISRTRKQEFVELFSKF